MIFYTFVFKHIHLEFFLTMQEVVYHTLDEPIFERQDIEDMQETYCMGCEL